MSNEKERRLYARAPEEFNVRVVRELKKDEYHEAPAHVVRTVNISGGGMLIAMDSRLEEREIVRISFLTPNTFELFEGRARVIRLEDRPEQGSRAGLKFVSISAAGMRKLDYHISLRGA